MSLNYLESFVTLCETLSFSETAKALRVTQPCVSRQIRLLEEQLRTQLFVRSRSGVRLSARGRELQIALGPLFKEIQKALRSARSEIDQISGRVSLGCLAEIGQSVFMEAALEFQAKHPAVMLEIEYLKEYEIVEKVKEGGLEFGIVTTPIESENIRSFPLREEPVVLVTRAKNSASLESWEELPVISYRAEDPLFARFKRRGLGRLKVLPRVWVNSHRSMVDALLAMDAYAVMPLHAVESLIDSGKLRKVGGLGWKNTLHLIHPAWPWTEKKHQAFKKHLMEWE